jgi:hypothetical protein
LTRADLEPGIAHPCTIATPARRKRMLLPLEHSTAHGRTPPVLASSQPDCDQGAAPAAFPLATADSHEPACTHTALAESPQGLKHDPSQDGSARKTSQHQ